MDCMLQEMRVAINSSNAFQAKKQRTSRIPEAFLLPCAFMFSGAMAFESIVVQPIDRMLHHVEPDIMSYPFR